MTDVSSTGNKVIKRLIPFLCRVTALQGCAASSLRRLLPGVRLFSNGPGAAGVWRGGDTRWGQGAKAPQPRVPLLAGRSVLTAAPRDVYLKTVLSGENRFYFT